MSRHDRDTVSCFSFFGVSGKQLCKWALHAGLCSFRWNLAVFHRAGFHTSIVILWEKQSRRTRICTLSSKTSTPQGQFHHQHLSCGQTSECVTWMFDWLTCVCFCFCFLLFFVFKFLLDTCPFLGPLIPLFLNFWWHVLWVSKPEWVLPYSNFAEA